MDWGFGLTVTVMGIVVTLATLYLLGWVIRLLTKLFPFKEEKEEKENKV